MNLQALIVGGGIGGLAASLAAMRAGWTVQLFERAPAFGEVGAGIQLGPNSTRLLNAWGLGGALTDVAAFPKLLTVRRATDGFELGQLRLGNDFVARYGAPYATLHRSDLHALLLKGAVKNGSLQLHLDSQVDSYAETEEGVQLSVSNDRDQGQSFQGDTLIGADGIWSNIRQQLLVKNHFQNLIKPTGHLAYRALVSQSTLPQSLRSQQVTVWLGPRLHVVSYPVRRGDWLNVVVIVHGQPSGDVKDWDHAGLAVDVHAALMGTCPVLQALVHAVQGWRLWVLCDSPPLRGPDQMAGGRCALLGDAAHAIRPYLAQGAGMALEDAAELGQCLASVQQPGMDVPSALRRYALNRWQRNARVQARAQRNGKIFHASGLMRISRDVAMKLGKERLLDVPWLYEFGQTVP